MAFLILFPLGAYLIESSKPKVYESKTLISLQNPAAVSQSGAPPQENIQAIARLVTTTPIARKAGLLMNPPVRDPSSLIGHVSATVDANTGFLTIVADDRTPQRAARVATAFGQAVGTYQTTQEIQGIDNQIAALQHQLAAIPLNQQIPRSTVTGNIATLRAQRGAAHGGVSVIEPATANANPVGPKTRRAVEIGLVIGLLLGIGAVLTAENSDRRLRTPEDLEALTDMRLLGVIPRSAFLPENLGDPAEEESFQMLRAALSYFTVDRPLKSVAIISPLVGDGKTTVATGLAVATARAGKRVILLDADLRRPQVAARLDIEEQEQGLGAVLTGEATLDDVLVEHEVGAPGGGQLLVLPVGPPPANPSALISSQQMRDLLRELEKRCDLVIVDTAAALAVSDSIPLVQSASAVAMIVRMNRSSSAAVRRLQKVIASAEGHPMGVVATGQPSPRGYGNYYYRYRYQYASNGHPGRRGKLARLVPGLGRRRPKAETVSSRNREHASPQLESVVEAANKNGHEAQMTAENERGSTIEVTQNGAPEGHPADGGKEELSSTQNDSEGSEQAAPSGASE